MRVLFLSIITSFVFLVTADTAFSQSNNNAGSQSASAATATLVTTFGRAKIPLAEAADFLEEASRLHQEHQAAKAAAARFNWCKCLKGFGWSMLATASVDNYLNEVENLGTEWATTPDYVFEELDLSIGGYCEYMFVEGGIVTASVETVGGTLDSLTAPFVELWNYCF